MPTATARASCRRCSTSHSPLDLVVIMLGHQRPEAVPRPHRARGGERHAPAGRRSSAATTRRRARRRPQIILVSPPQLCDTDHPDMMRHFGGCKAIDRRVKEIRRTGTALRAEELGVHFFDASTVAKTGSARRRASRRGQHPRDRRGARAAGQAGARPVTRALDHPPRDARPTRARLRCSSTSPCMAASLAAGRGTSAPREPTIPIEVGRLDMLDEDTEFSWRKCDHRGERR